MITARTSTTLLPEAYLAAEQTSEIKHEYIDGQVYAMAGTTDIHNTIAGNLFAMLHTHLSGTGCRVFFADVKAKIRDRNCFYYPDLMVSCDERDRNNSLFKEFPCLIVEVLSESTEAFDRGDKFVDYQSLSSLQEYVLISTKRKRIDCFRRNDNGLWVLQSFDRDKVIPIKETTESSRIVSAFQ
jgi:Uma2 family endonuclease